MRIVATSDFHGTLPTIPECDLLIIAGDVCPIWQEDLGFQLNWLDRQFRGWLEYVPATHIVGIAGNHDHVFEKWPGPVRDLSLPWHYLQDDRVEIEGVRIYGLPWIPNLPGWAFYATDDRLKMAFEAVPDDIDIVVSHGPPEGLLDNKYGTPYANEMIRRVMPELFICGHIHEGYGHVKVGPTDIYNVCFCDITYTPGQRPRKVGRAD